MNHEQIGALIGIILLFSLWVFLYHFLDKYNRKHRIYSVLYHDPYSSSSQVFIFYSQSLKEAQDFGASLDPKDFIGIYKTVPQNFLKQYGGTVQFENKHSKKE